MIKINNLQFYNVKELDNPQPNIICDSKPCHFNQTTHRLWPPFQALDHIFFAIMSLCVNLLFILLKIFKGFTSTFLVFLTAYKNI